MNKPYYFPGQTVRGYAIIDIFNALNNKSLILRVKGKENIGKFTPKIFKSLVNYPETFKQITSNETPKINIRFDKGEQGANL